MRPALARLLLGILAIALPARSRPAFAAPPPANLTIIGAAGDLTGRLLMPSLVQLHKEALLPAGTRVIGMSFSSPDYPDDARFRDWMKTRVGKLSGAVDEKSWSTFADRLHFQAGNITSAADVVGLGQRLASLDAQDGAARRRNIFYLALPPSLMKPAILNLAQAGLIGPGIDADLVVEKPIGIDEKSAKEINDLLERHVGEAHTWRMDHFLGKESVRSIFDLRFKDARFARVWSKKFIDRIEINAGEQIGIEGRGAFMEQSGATRDMVQSHLLQALALLTMDRPRTLSPSEVRAQKIKLLESIRPLKPHEVDKKVVRGQYTAGAGRTGYREEPGVAPRSSVETFVAMPVEIGARPWKRVPVVVHTGKGEREKDTSMEIHFRRLPLELLPPGRDPGEGGTLRISIAPTAKITLDGEEIALPHDGPKLLPYARQLSDLFAGDPSMFVHRRESEAAWRVIDPIERAWQKAGTRGLRFYPAGSRGPQQARRLLH